MNTITTIAALLAGLGFGTILSKIFDIWMSRQKQVKEYQDWLLNKRYSAYSDIAMSLLSAIDDENTNWNYHTEMAKATNAMLLINDNKLIDVIWTSIVEVNEMNQKISTLTSDDTEIIKKLRRDTGINIHYLVRRLRDSLLQHPNRAQHLRWNEPT